LPFFFDVTFLVTFLVRETIALRALSKTIYFNEY
jgi:hypothetical protein